MNNETIVSWLLAAVVALVLGLGLYTLYVALH
jgi:hypothetical protein